MNNQEVREWLESRLAYWRVQLADAEKASAACSDADNESWESACHSHVRVLESELRALDEKN